MKFRTGTSYNSHDVKVTEGERIYVEFNVIRRCTITINAIVRHGAEGASVEELTAHINKRLNSFYSEGDIQYAADRLAKDGLVEKHGRKTYRAAPSALAAWKAIEKKKI